MMGIQSGDIIVAVNNYPVNSLTLKKILQQNIGKEISLDIRRLLS